MPRRSARSESRSPAPAPAPLPRGARDLAFQALDQHKRTGEFVRPILDERAAAGLLSAVDRALAVELTHGVIRRQGTLNAILQPHVRRPRHSIEGPLWTLLQLGAYQLVFLESIPPHAAVDETVETAKRLGRRRWAGLLNGTLRSVAAGLREEFVNQPAADAVPLSAGRFRRFDRAVFPPPESDPQGYFARAFSFPDWLVARWSVRFPFDELLRTGFWFNSPQPVFLRANPLTTTRDQLLAALRDAGISAAPGSLPESIQLESSGAAGGSRVRASGARHLPPVDQLPGYEAGWFSVQDETASRAAILLDPQPGWDVLDLCAAPGTKATHLAERMQNRGRVIATDVHADRLPLIAENARRLGTSIVETRALQADGTDIPAGPFDAVLVDVPCTNTGVLGKRPEARWRLRPRDVAELPLLQRRLLADACRRLKPGGRVVYSTCSIEPEENECVVRSVIERHPELSLVAESQYTPGHSADGGYQALLLRTQ